ncbi:hypothetical protein KCH_07320 [Kitasatospora cheerisanensis KCTC 2395]|uniref:Uncharacterized protein n=1 Tax=Kitasatospora cheerisanensis KCTC 2395 TaxID=1348663 RepID=A0A066ZB22_9ACTN|nr:hypothetical protein KCH_07320 [Kitasatospora cheerisanensis KCTC 2395]
MAGTLAGGACTAGATGGEDRDHRTGDQGRRSSLGHVGTSSRGGRSHGRRHRPAFGEGAGRPGRGRGGRTVPAV